MRLLPLALLLVRPAEAALTTDQRSALAGWLFGDGNRCPVAANRLEAAYGVDCPTVFASLPANRCFIVLSNQCTQPVTCTETRADDEGPNYLPGATATEDLRDSSASGTDLVISGSVLDTDCNGVAGAQLDIWHTDPEGEYDFEEPYSYRGLVTAGADGRYSFTTHVPGRPTGPDGSPQPLHVHFTATASGLADLTTQLFFEDDDYPETGADADTQFCELVADGAGGYTCEWDIVMP